MTRDSYICLISDNFDVLTAQIEWAYQFMKADFTPDHITYHFDIFNILLEPIKRNLRFVCNENYEITLLLNKEKNIQYQIKTKLHTILLNKLYKKISQ